MKKPSGFIENYSYKDYVFKITYNKQNGNYYAESSLGLTYSDDLRDLKDNKIPKKVWQNTEFKL